MREEAGTRTGTARSSKHPPLNSPHQSPNERGPTKGKNTVDKHPRAGEKTRHQEGEDKIPQPPPTNTESAATNGSSEETSPPSSREINILETKAQKTEGEPHEAAPKRHQKKW